jgi:uncharacterized protein (TIGR02145 family)
MNTTKTLFAVLAAVSVCSAQSVNISGIVKNSAGIGITGAAVKLEKGGQTATTGSDGSFTLTNATSVKGRINQSQPNQQFVAINNGIVYVNFQAKSAIKITAFDLTGKALSTVQQLMDAENHSIALPRIGVGVYLYKVKSGNSEFVLKCNSVVGATQGNAVSVQGSSSSNALTKQAKVAASINDVIAVTKDGYLNYRVVVYNSDTSGIEIQMIVCAGTVTDADGNVYQSVRIGNQVWTVENLRTTKYNDKSAIPLVTDGVEWGHLTTPGYCYFNNTTNADSIKKYGVLYNWYAADIKKLATAGWHVPTDAEWDTLQNYLIVNGGNWDGTTMGNKIAKCLAAKTDWLTSIGPGASGNDLTKNNESGFSALPDGKRYGGSSSDYYFGFCLNAYWWSTTESDVTHAYGRTLYDDRDGLDRNSYGKFSGICLRLLRDN